MTYAELQASIKRYITAPAGKDSLIQDTINMVYLNEVLRCDPFNPMFWLRDYDDSKFSIAPATISGITKASPGVVTTAAAHGLVDGDIIMFQNIVGMAELNGRLLQVGTVPGTTSFQIEDLDGTSIVTTNFTTYSSGGTINHHGFKLATTGRDVDELLLCKWHGEGLMDSIDINEFERYTSFMDSSSSRPTRYMHRKTYSAAGVELSQLVWFNGADAAYHLRYWFIKRVATMTADANVPILPPQFHNAIVSGVIARLKEVNIQTENPEIWAPLYRIQTDAIVNYNQKWYQEHAEEIRPYLL